MRILLSILVLLLLSCSQHKSSNSTAKATEQTKQYILSLERKWLEAEFVLDTAYIATLIDSTFFSISPDHISDKEQELNGTYDNISAMRKDSIFLDSLKLEDAMVNLYANAAVVTFIVHTYKKDKGMPTEKRTRFYDVWVKRDDNWKAVSAQGTVVVETNGQ